MAHNNTVLMAVAPWRKPHPLSKTLAATDFYLTGPAPAIHWVVFQHARQNFGRRCCKEKRAGCCAPCSHFWAERSVDVWVMSEDLPDPNNRSGLMTTARFT